MTGGLAVKHVPLSSMRWICPNRQGSQVLCRQKVKCFLGINFSHLTTSWVADHVNWRCHIH